MPTFFPENNEPRSQDGELRTLQKILGALYAGGSGTGGGALATIYTGSGDPNNVVVGSVGNLYLQTDEPSIWFKQTGSNTNTGWV